MGTKYYKEVTCNYSVFTDTMDLYSIGITSTNTNTFSPTISKKAGIIRTTIVNFGIDIVKKANRIINLAYSTLATKTNKAYKAISINYTEFIDTIDLYNIYITATNNISMQISNITKKADKYINANYIVSISKNNKLYRNILIAYNVLSINTKLIVKDIINISYKINTSIKKTVNKNITAFNNYLITKNNKIKHYTNVFFDMLIANTKKISQTKTVLTKFTANFLKKLPKFKFFASSKTFIFYAGDGMDVFSKQPGEKYPIQFSFNNILLDTNEIIASYTIVATLNNETATTIVIDSDRKTTTSIYATVKSGITGSNYKITTKITTDLGNVYEKDVLMKVCEV